jgi:hypothetical protein
MVHSQQSGVAMRAGGGFIADASAAFGTFDKWHKIQPEPIFSGGPVLTLLN